MQTPALRTEPRLVFLQSLSITLRAFLSLLATQGFRMRVVKMGFGFLVVTSSVNMCIKYSDEQLMVL